MKADALKPGTSTVRVGVPGAGSGAVGAGRPGPSKAGFSDNGGFSDAGSWGPGR